MARSHETLFMTEGECEGWMRGAGGGERIKTETRHQLVNEREREGERVITLTQTQEERRGEARSDQPGALWTPSLSMSAQSPVKSTCFIISYLVYRYKHFIFYLHNLKK